MASTDHSSCVPEFVGVGSQVFHIIPRTHLDDLGNPASIVHGDRTPESDMVVIRLTGDPIIHDNSFHNRPVQEPYEQVPNTTLFISTEGRQVSTESQHWIRLKALFYDSVDGEWEVRQQLQQVGQELNLKDMLLPIELAFRMPGASYDSPETPTFQPTVEGDGFTSAVLAKDINDNWRVFAVHSVIGAETTQDFFRVQWYVIDPKLDDIHDSDVLNEDWQPQLIAYGTITTDGVSAPDAGHAYHPSMAVSPDGEVFIEYTYSSETVEQRIVRAKLNTAYTGVSSFTTMLAGPDLGYDTDLLDRDRWAMFSSMQIDPAHGGFGFCNFTWSAHTLVFDDPLPFGNPPLTNSRDIWLFRKATRQLCFTTDLNADGVVDPYDLMLYNEYYMTGDERADTNADGVVDVVDMGNFIDAYDAATRP